jgi:hypothetical protein
LGRKAVGYPQAVADLERVKEEALEARKTGNFYSNSLLAKFVSEVTGTLVGAGYRDPDPIVSRVPAFAQGIL